MAEKRTGLGRGLDALLPGRQAQRPGAGITTLSPQEQHRGDKDGALTLNTPTQSPTDGDWMGHGRVDKDALSGARLIAVDAVERNPYQTRGKIDEAALAELTASIREQGVLQPILVRVVGGRSSVVGEGQNKNQTQNLATAKDAEVGKGTGANQNQNQKQVPPTNTPSAGAVGDPVSGRNDNSGGASTSNSATSTNAGGAASRTLSVGSVDGAVVGSNPTIRPSDQVRYQLMAGERRWMAAQRAGLKVIPAVVKQASDEQAMEITIIENLQREDLNPMEQARAFERLSREFQLTQEQIALKTGKERASVANFLRLLKLPAGVQAHIEADRLSLGHGKVLMMLTNEPAEMVERVAARAAESGMSVRELEELVMKLMGPPHGAAGAEREAERKDPNVRAAEEMMQRALGCRVTVKDRMGKGKIILEYASLEDFDRIVEVLGN